MKPSITIAAIALSAVLAGLAPASAQVLQYGFDASSGAVAVPVIDDSGSGHPATNLLFGPAPVYSADIPAAGGGVGKAQHVTGVGSVDFSGTNASLSTAASTGVGSGQGIITATDVFNAGGLTMEVWVKNPTSAEAATTPGAALSMGGMYLLGTEGGKIGFYPGDAFSSAWATDQFNPGEWSHIAVVMTTSDEAAKNYSDVSAYVNGVLIHSAAKSFPWFLGRATSVGNHQYNDWSDFEGLVYEPRISLGPLSPNQFTVVPPPAGLSAPASLSDSTNGGTVPFEVTVKNTADVSYNVTSISFSGSNAGEFSESFNSFPLEITAHGSDIIYVDFTPTSGGLAEATLTISTNDPNYPKIDVALSVNVMDPEVVIDPSLAFGLFEIPPGPTTGTVNVDNFGETQALILSNPQITGSGAAAYSVTGLPDPIEAFGSDVVEVTFDPNGAGGYSAQLSLDTNDPFHPTVTVALSGSVNGNGTPVLQYGFDFTSGTVADSGGTVADDSGKGNTGKLLAPGRGNGGSYTSDIPVAGSAEGLAKNVTGIGSLDITGENSLSTGTGAFTGEALAGLSGADVDAAGGITYEMWVKNISDVSGEQFGTHLLTLGGMHGLGTAPDGSGKVGFFYGDAGGNFLTSTIPIDTSNWTHIAATMNATPGEGGRKYDKITFYVNGVKAAVNEAGHTFPWFLNRAAGVGMHGVFLAGNADGLVYEPRISVGVLKPADFTVVPPPPGIFAPEVVTNVSDGSSMQLFIPVENTDTTIRNLSASSFTGPNASDFSDVALPESIAGGSSTDLILNFTPSNGAGIYHVTLTINSDDPNRPAYKVNITIEVHDPQIGIDPSLTFGALTGPGTELRSIFVDNLGATADLILSNPQFTGAGAAAYSLTSLPGPIGAGEYKQVEITFNLGSVGTFPAQLTFETNDIFQPTVSVDLSGEVTALVGAKLRVTSVKLVNQSRLRIDFQGEANTAHFVKSSVDLQSRIFTGGVPVAVDGLTTDGTGAGFVEIDITGSDRKFYQIQKP